MTWFSTIPSSKAAVAVIHPVMVVPGTHPGPLGAAASTKHVSPELTKLVPVQLRVQISRKLVTKSSNIGVGTSTLVSNPYDPLGPKLYSERCMARPPLAATPATIRFCLEHQEAKRRREERQPKGWKFSFWQCMLIVMVAFGLCELWDYSRQPPYKLVNIQ